MSQQAFTGVPGTPLLSPTSWFPETSALYGPRGALTCRKHPWTKVVAIEMRQKEPWAWGYWELGPFNLPRPGPLT